MIASPFGASSVLALKSSLEPGISSCTELSAMSWKIFVFSSSKSRICLSFCWSCSVGVNRKQGWRQKIKALARKPERFLRYWPHLVEHDSVCWVWQHNSALGNLAQQAQKINNAREASCKPGLQLSAGCRIEKSHSLTIKPNPKLLYIFPQWLPSSVPGRFYLSGLSLSHRTISFQTQTHKGLLHLHLYPWTGERAQLLQEHSQCPPCLTTTAECLTWCALCPGWSVSSHCALLWSWHGLPPSRDPFHPCWSGTNLSLHELLLVQSTSSERSQWISGPSDGNKWVRRVTRASSQIHISIEKVPINHTATSLRFVNIFWTYWVTKKTKQFQLGQKKGMALPSSNSSVGKAVLPHSISRKN